MYVAKGHAGSRAGSHPSTHFSNNTAHPTQDHREDGTVRGCLAREMGSTSERRQQVHGRQDEAKE